MENLMLKANRIKIRLSKSEAAILAHMTIKNYIAIENNVVEPKMTDMMNISNAFHVSMDELFNW